MVFNIIYILFFFLMLIMYVINVSIPDIKEKRIKGNIKKVIKSIILPLVVFVLLIYRILQMLNT